MNREINKILLINILGGVLLVLQYFFCLDSYPVVWELSDEALYLWNASFFTGQSWNNIASIPAYSGFGYSIFFIIPFLLFKTGDSIISFAYIMNIVFIILLYIVIILILIRINTKNKWNAVISYISCSTAFLHTNALKVLPEVLLSLLFALIIYLLLEIYNKEKLIHYIFLAICMSYSYFVHIRVAVPIIVAVFFCLFVTFTSRKKENIYKFIVFICLFLFSVISLYCIKNDILRYKMTLVSTNTENEIANVITKKYLVDRVYWLLNEKTKNYLLGFVTKLIYSIYATCGLLIIVLCYCIKIVRMLVDSKISKKDKTNDVIYVYVAISALAILFAQTINGLGLDDVRTIIYGRYYEYIFPIVIALGLVSVMNQKIILNYRQCSLVIIIACLFVIAVYEWLNMIKVKNISLLDGKPIIDSARTDAVLNIVSKADTWREVFLYFSITSIVFLLIIFVSKTVKSFIFVVMVIILSSLLKNSEACVECVREIHCDFSSDREMAEIIKNKIGTKELFFLEDHSYIDNYYAEMQVLLNKPLIKVLYLDDTSKQYDYNDLMYEMEKGDLIFFYTTSNHTPYNTKLSEVFNEIIKSKHYVLYEFTG